MKQKIAFGIVIGLSAGLLLDSCLVVLAYTGIIFVSPVLLIPPLAGIFFGIRLANVGMIPQWPWPVILLSGLFILATAALAPYMLSVAELRWQGNAIPLLQGSFLLETHTGPLGSSMAGPSITKILDTETDGTDALSFYLNRFEKDGWKNVSIREDEAWLTKKGRHMHIYLFKNQNHSRVKVVYNLDYVRSPIVVLLVAFAFYFYIWHYYKKQRQR